MLTPRKAAQKLLDCLFHRLLSDYTDYLVSGETGVIFMN